MQALHIIKIGGNVIDNSENLHSFLKDMAALDGFMILVHGGGKVATQWWMAAVLPILRRCA
jgi:acetylglutamate kinase